MYGIFRQKFKYFFGELREKDLLIKNTTSIIIASMALFDYKKLYIICSNPSLNHTYKRNNYTYNQFSNLYTVFDLFSNTFDDKHQNLVILMEDFFIFSSDLSVCS